MMCFPTNNVTIPMCDISKKTPCSNWMVQWSGCLDSLLHEVPLELLDFCGLSIARFHGLPSCFPLKCHCHAIFFKFSSVPNFDKKKTSHISREHIDQSWPHVMPRAPLAIASSQRSHQTRLAAQRPVQIAAVAIPSGLGCPMPWRSQTQWVYINPELYRLMTISQYLDISNLWW